MTDTERAKMLRGEPYLASDPVLVGARQRARLLLMRLNASSPEDASERLAILMDLSASRTRRVDRAAVLL